MTLRRKTPLKRSSKRIAPVRARFNKTFWSGQREAVSNIQGGICAHCGIEFSALDTAHIEGLGRLVPGGRNNPEHWKNQLPNLLGLCRECHQNFDSQPLSTRKIVGAELKKKFNWPAD